ncbi:MAG TPA: methyl-accepting chemotaxis protein [Xanthobacteraceae bacterium]|nr:methyl-accepting chemotaxis protein [Xanthobacteraceae bacterium]
MLSRFSISVLLKSVIAVMGVVIVVMLALSARESWDRLTTANRIAGVANVSAYMFQALNGLRVDRFSTARDLIGERQFTSMDPLIQNARDKEMPALHGLVTALATLDYPDRDQAITDFSARIKRYADLQEKTATAIQQPKAARPPGLADEYGKEGDGLIAALDMWGTRLVKYISLQDPYVDQLLEIKQLAWTMRNAAGNMSLVVSNGLAGIAPPPNALMTYAGNSATLDTAWAAVNDIAARLPPTPGLAAAIEKFKTDFVGSTYPEMRLKVLKQLVAGEPTGLTVEQWSPNSVGKLALTLGISIAALDAAKEQAATQSATAWHDLTMQLALLIAACALSGGMMFFVSRHVTGPLGAIRGAMLKLAGGDFDVVLPGLERTDEIGAVANAVERFKVLAVDKARNEADAAMARQKAEADRHAEAARVEAEAQAKIAAERAKAAEEQAHAFRMLGEALGHLANGDFTIRLDDDISDAYAQIKGDFNRAIGRLHETIQAVATSTREVANAAGEISTATTDLSQRVEEQAASLAETSASMEEISSTVQTNAKNAQHANELTNSTQGVADRGGKVVAEAVTAMSRIEESSRQISDIITVIDEIARQTNLLALNAAVEAARAGDAGRGFAVVASEVRSLAQRSSEAAKNITDLIAKSSDRVQEGVGLVNRAGTALSEIVASIKQVADIVANIATASAEQSTGLEQISKALAQMDEVTQQNSALVEENTATAKTLEQQSHDMQTRIASFKLDRGVAASMSKKRTAA